MMEDRNPLVVMPELYVVVVYQFLRALLGIGFVGAPQINAVRHVAVLAQDKDPVIQHGGCLTLVAPDRETAANRRCGLPSRLDVPSAEAPRGPNLDSLVLLPRTSASLDRLVVAGGIELA